MDRRVLLLATALLTGCANSPTTATREDMPVRFDAGGGWTGSGSYTGLGPGGDGVLATSGVGGSVIDDSTSTTGTERGGGSFGSGN